MSRLSIYRSGGPSRRHTQMISAPTQELFPVLDAKELAVTLQTIQIPATEELILRPSPAYMKQTFELLLEYYSAVPADLIEKKANIPFESNEGKNIEGDDEDDTKGAMNSLVLFRMTKEFLDSVSFYDLTLADIVKPDPLRTRKILSAFINYARFLEEHSDKVEDHMNELESVEEKARQLTLENEKILQSIEDLKKKLESDDSDPKKITLKQISSYNFKLETELKKLKKSQELLTLAHTKYKEEKRELVAKVQDFEFVIAEADANIDKYKGHLNIDIGVSKKVIEDLKLELANMEKINQERQTRASNMTTTIDSIQLVETELKNLLPILEEIGRVSQSEIIALARLNDIQDIANDFKKKTIEQENQLARNEQEFKYHTDRVEKSKKMIEERTNKHQSDLVKNRNQYNTIIEDRRKKEEEFSTMKSNISELEKSILQLKSDYNHEVNIVQQKIDRLTSQINLYMDEVQKKL